MQVHLTKISSNAKTGPIPVSTTCISSCPPTCPLKTSCYAKNGRLYLHWSQVSRGERGTDWATFCEQISALPPGQLWRANQAGDLPHTDGVIDHAKLAHLVQANRGRRGFTYTHHSMEIQLNRLSVAAANRRGFVINLSADNLDQADNYKQLKIAPVTVLLPADSDRRGKTPAGHKWLQCPAQYMNSVTCESCQLCARESRPIIGFQPDGNTAKRMSEDLACQ